MAAISPAQQVQDFNAHCLLWDYERARQIATFYSFDSSPNQRLTMTIRHIVFDHALPLSESAAAGADPRTMADHELLAALLVTYLESQNDLAGVLLVRRAMTPPARRTVRPEELPAGALF